MLYNILKSQIATYKPYNQHESADKALIMQCMELFPNLISRDNQICHFTASSWIINPERTKVLMLYHNINQRWMWPGGHTDGDTNLLRVALREACEETSLKHLRPISNEIFSLEVFAVPAHLRKGELVTSHLHLNCSFLCEADETEVFQIKPDENSKIRWMSLEEISAAIARNIMEVSYTKLIEKTRQL